MIRPSILARVALASVVPMLLCSGCMVRRVTITETMPTGETRQKFIEVLDSGDDPSTLTVESAVLDGDLLEVLVLSQAVGCRTCAEARAEQVTISKNKLDNNAPMGIGLLYGLGAVALIPLVKADDYDGSDWRLYGPVMAAGIGLLIAPSATLLSTVPKTTIGRDDVWLATEVCEDAPCPQNLATEVLLFLAVPAAEGEPTPVANCVEQPDRCVTTDPEGRALFDLAMAGFPDRDLARGELGVFVQAGDEAAQLHGFDIATTPVHAAAMERLAAE